MILANWNHVPYILVVFSCFILGHHSFQFPTVVPPDAHHTHQDNHLRRTLPMNGQNYDTVSRNAHEATEASSDIEEILRFDEDTWEAYESAVKEVLESKRVLKKEKLENLEDARKALLSRNRLSSIPSPLQDRKASKEYLMAQKQRYVEHYNLSSAQYNYVMRCLVYLGDFCAKQKRAPGIRVAWEKMKESGILPRENAISTYMYILGTDDSCHDALVEVATFHDVLFPPNEKTTTLRIKAMIGKNEVNEAEKILSSLSVSVAAIGTIIIIQRLVWRAKNRLTCASAVQRMRTMEQDGRSCGRSCLFWNTTARLVKRNQYCAHLGT